jgi:HAD superfamily hydrolase (TIGR01490 family)
MMMHPKTPFNYLACYDLDHTILVDNSATHLMNEARKRGIMSERHFRHAIYLSILYKIGIGDSADMIIRMLTWLKGLQEDMIRELCTEVFNRLIIQKIRPEIIQTIEEHRANKGAVVLLSSASEPICEPVSRYLALDDVICSRLESVGGVLTGRTVGNLVYGIEKKRRLLAYCQEYGFNLTQAFYYGDSFTDHHVMAAVGHPVAVDPDRKLYGISLRNGWPVMLRNRA